MAVQSFQQLVVWQKAMGFVAEVYKVTAAFPKEERFGLTNQLRRSAVSIPSNIAEGQGRRSTRDFLNFLSIAYGSLSEAQTQIMLGGRLAFVDRKDESRLLELANEVGRLINGLSKSLARRKPNPESNH